MSRSTKLLIVNLLFMFTLMRIDIWAQANLYYTNEANSKLIEYLINKGSFKLKYPLIKPYTISELKYGMEATNTQLEFAPAWAEELNSYSYDTDKLPTGILRGELNLNFETGLITKSRNSFKLSANYQAGDFAFRSSFHFDQRFKDDSTYFGELGEWYYGRFDESYISYSDTTYGLYAAYGRVPRNLGYYATQSLILSHNPYSYDHLWLQFKNNIFSFSFLTTRLEDKFGYDDRLSDSSSFGWYKRFYALHRLDLNLAENLKLALTEAVLYGGRNQQWLSYYLNPLVPFYISKNNQRSSTNEGNANIYLALDLWYKPFKDLTLFSQVFIDDIDFKSENRAAYPERKALFASATVTDYLIPFSQYGMSYTWVENWTYNSFYTWANYNIHERGMGFPFNSYQEYQLFFDYFGLQKMILSGKFSYTEKGENSLNSAFSATFEKFPMGVVERKFSFELNTSYFFSWKWVAIAQFALSQLRNKGNIMFHHETNFQASLSLKFIF